MRIGGGGGGTKRDATLDENEAIWRDERRTDMEEKS